MRKALTFFFLLTSLLSCTTPKHFRFGTAENPEGETIFVDSNGFIINGNRTIPVAGEMHFQRVPRSEWRNELLKMKAGGITIVTSYVFWGCVEPVEGAFDFSGSNDLRAFLEECGKCGLMVLLRPGPWAHGEWYLGGLPEWVVDQGIADPAKFEVRSMAPGFIASVTRYFNALGEQTRGLMWKDGGPLVGLQVDNECFGPWEYFHSVKKIVVDSGFDIPFYTKTGGPHIEEGVDEGEFLPLGGIYVDGFWNGELCDMPAQYNESFLFKDNRWNADPEGGEGKEPQLLFLGEKCPIPGLSYPNLMCELGAGMMTSYHRRIRIYDNDIRASVITRLGTGCNMPGYYMYHGGTNPWNPSGTYAECRESKYTNANDLPERTYDFQAPLGEMGKPNISYHHLRLIHQFLADWGGELSLMDPELGHSEVRSAIRSLGKSGFVFVNNYERMKALGTCSLDFCGQTIEVPEGRSFVFPYGMKYKSLKIDWATAQPFCTTDDAIWFAAVDGIEARLCINGKVVTPELDKPVMVKGVTVMVMSPEKSLKAYKVDGRVLFSDGIIYKDADKLMCETWEYGEDIPVVKTKDANPARVPEMLRNLILFPKPDEMAKSASWTFEIPELENPEDWFVAVSYQGDIAHAKVGDVLVEDNFWNGREMYIRISDLPGKKLTLDILPLPQGFPVYLQKEQREVLASTESGYLCSLESVRLVHRVRTEIQQ